MRVKNKPALVLISGWGADERVWLPVEPFLSQHFSVYKLSLMSERQFAASGLDDLVDAIAEAIPPASVVCAWSLGAMLAVKVAERFPDKVRRLVLVACNASFVQTNRWPPAMDSATFSQFVSAFETRPEKTQRRFVALQAKGTEGEKTLLKNLNDISALTPENHQHAMTLLKLLGELDISQNLSALTIPILFVFGENDALVPVAAAPALENLLRAQVASGSCLIHSIPNCGHVPHVSHSGAFLTSLTAFLELDDKRFWKDKKKIAQSFSKASEHYDHYAGLQRDVAARLVKNIGKVEGRVVDLGCGTGYCMELLAEENQAIEALTGVDIAFDMLRKAREKLCDLSLPLRFCLADIEHLPIEAGSLDWAVSSLAIQWCDDLPSLFSEVAAVLKPSGCFAFSNLGPQTLRELNAAWEQADASHVHVNQFFSKDEIVEAAANAGFELIQITVEYKVLYYEKLVGLMQDLKGIGAHNVNGGSNKGLTGKATMKALIAAYENCREDNGKLPATYELHYWLCKKCG